MEFNMLILTGFSTAGMCLTGVKSELTQSCCKPDRVTLIHLLPMCYVTHNKSQSSLSFIFIWGIEIHRVINRKVWGENQTGSFVKKISAY